MNIGDYVYEWSPHQKQFHVETVVEMIKRNRSIYARQRLGDYIVLGFADSREAAHAALDKIEGPEKKDTPDDDTSA